MAKTQTIDSFPKQVQRMNAVVNHVQHMGPASREWVLARLKAVECRPTTVEMMRYRGIR